MGPYDDKVNILAQMVDETFSVVDSQTDLQQELSTKSEFNKQLEFWPDKGIHFFPLQLNYRTGHFELYLEKFKLVIPSNFSVFEKLKLSEQFNQLYHCTFTQDHDQENLLEVMKYYFMNIKAVTIFTNCGVSYMAVFSDSDIYDHYEFINWLEFKKK